jgi:integrase
MGPPHALADAGGRNTSDFVFPGGVKERPLSPMAFLMLLRRFKRDDITAHPFRSTFRDWAAERTDFPNEVVEMALAHTISNKVEAAFRFAYQREYRFLFAGFGKDAQGAKYLELDPLRDIAELHLRP